MCPAPTKPSRTNSESQPSRRIVFVVDDDSAVLTSLKFSLELEGFEVRTFSDAQSLLRKPDISRQAFLVIDYRLPDTNGLDLLQRLRAKGVSTPAVIITTNPSQDMYRRAAALNVPIVEKPLLDNSLLATIRKHQLSVNKQKA